MYQSTQGSLWFRICIICEGDHKGVEFIGNIDKHSTLYISTDIHDTCYDTEYLLDNCRLCTVILNSDLRGNCYNTGLNYITGHLSCTIYVTHIAVTCNLLWQHCWCNVFVYSLLAGQSAQSCYTAGCHSHDVCYNDLSINIFVSQTEVLQRVCIMFSLQSVRLCRSLLYSNIS